MLDSAADGSWQPVRHVREHITVRGGLDETLDVELTRHGGTDTPVLTPVLHDETRTLALRWTLYDPAADEIPTLLFAEAHDYASFEAAMAHFGGPAENTVYADKKINHRKADKTPEEAGLKLLRAPQAPKEIPVTMLIKNPGVDDWIPFLKK